MAPTELVEASSSQYHLTWPVQHVVRDAELFD